MSEAWEELKDSVVYLFCMLTKLYAMFLAVVIFVSCLTLSIAIIFHAVAFFIKLINQYIGWH